MTTNTNLYSSHALRQFGNGVTHFMRSEMEVRVGAVCALAGIGTLALSSYKLAGGALTVGGTGLIAYSFVEMVHAQGAMILGVFMEGMAILQFLLVVIRCIGNFVFKHLN